MGDTINPIKKTGRPFGSITAPPFTKVNVADSILDTVRKMNLEARHQFKLELLEKKRLAKLAGKKTKPKPKTLVEVFAAEEVKP